MFMLVGLIFTSSSFITFINGEVVEITNEKSYQDFLTDNPVSIIKYFAPWCGHCKSLAPTWEEYGKQEDKDYKVAKVDCTTEANKPICSKEGIRGFPTIKVFVDQQSIQHQGARTIEQFDKSVEKAKLEFRSPKSDSE